LEESSMDDAKRAALIAASDRCERIAAANINPNALLDELRKAIAVLKSRRRMLFMRVHKYWLEYDAAALAFLVVGMAAVGLLAMII
jgi:hypothetical protein